MTRDLMTAFQDAKGNKISYTYDDMERLLSAAQTVTVNGNRETVRNNYSYTDDNLTELFIMVLPMILTIMLLEMSVMCL